MNLFGNRRLKDILSVFAITALLTITTFAQSDQSRIAGTVVDANGGAIAWASVIVKNEITGEERTVVAGDDGTFQVVALKPTTYTVSATANSFENSSQKGIELLVGQEVNVTLTLQPTGVTAQVDIVGGEESTINTSSASIGVNVTPREVASLPLRVLANKAAIIGDR